MNDNIHEYYFDKAIDLGQEQIMKDSLTTRELRYLAELTEHLEHSPNYIEAYNQYIIYYLDQISR